MNEEEKMFSWGVGLAVFIIVLTAGLQVCFRTNDKMRAHVRAKIVKTQQDIAERTADFATYVRPEVLRNLVVSLYPKSEVISFNKSVSINEVSAKE